MRGLPLLVIVAACSRDRGPPPPANAPWTQVVLATAPGLSGLAADAEGRLWTVAERAQRAYRVTLDDKKPPKIETFTIGPVPDDTDLEGIEELGGDAIAFGTEGQDDSNATVLTGVIRGSAIQILTTITLPEKQIGIAMQRNHGAEGICGAGGTLLAAIEGAGIDGGKRWAPVLRIVDGAVARRYRVWLTSKTGKLSALDCDLSADGTATVWAVERHFEVSRILTFTLPPVGQGSDDITPRIAFDFAPYLGPKINLEGIAHLPDGRIVVVNDNQYRTIEEPSTLYVLPADVVR